MHGRMREPGRRQQPELAGPELPPGLHEDLAALHILAGGTDMAPGGRAGQDPHTVPGDLAVLDGHDRVGARRDGRAGRDAHRLAAAHGRLGPLTDERPADDPQLDRLGRARRSDLTGPHREAVHRR